MDALKLKCFQKNYLAFLVGLYLGIMQRELHGELMVTYSDSSLKIFSFKKNNITRKLQWKFVFKNVLKVGNQKPTCKC
jgi:hypothetical protein